MKNSSPTLLLQREGSISLTKRSPSLFKRGARGEFILILLIITTLSFPIMRKLPDGNVKIYSDSEIGGITISQNDFVGIGTNNPQHKLDIIGTVNATNFEGNGSGLTNITTETANHLSNNNISQFVNDSGYIDNITLIPGPAQNINNNDTISVGNYNYKIVNGNNNNVNSNTYTPIQDGLYDGQLLIIVGGNNNTVNIKDSGNTMLKGMASIKLGQTLTVIWVQPLGKWVETSRSIN